MKFLVLFCCFFALQSAHAQDVKMLLYKIHQPSKASKHPPVLFLLHGYGADENDLLSLHQQLPSNLLIVSIRAPYAEGEGFKWWDIGKASNDDNLSKATTAVEHVIKYVQQQLHLDSTHIFVGGFSQGAMLSLHLALTHPQLYKGIIAFSGKLLPETRSITTSDNQYSKLNILICHGNDDNVIPIAEAEAATTFLSKMKIRYTYNRYKMAHSIIDSEMQDVSEWMLPLLK
jgi:phospholipase/carboxylesterase